MSKLLLLSSLIAHVAIPMRLAKDKNPMRALRRTLAAMFAFNVFYWVAVVLVYYMVIWRAAPPVVNYGW